jgi:Ca2+-binding RTX toxin-like protein
MYGGAGNDGFFGGGGDDIAYGGDGNDRIYGDGGNDTMIGGAGNDTMTGGTTNGAGDKGANTYVWARADVVTASGTSAGLDHITDFGGGDKLDFTALFNDTHPADVKAVVHVLDTTAGTVVSADLGAGFTDVVVLDGVHHVTVDDLINSHSIVV